MSDQTLQTQVSKTIERYSSDEIMLDAFLQWARNPTAKGAGYGLDENYPYIAKNLAARYGISRPETEKYVAALRNACDSLREQIGEIRMVLLETLTQGQPWHVLLTGVLKRLSKTSDETRRALLTFGMLESVGHPMSPGSLTSPPGDWPDPQSEFQAYYNAMWGDTVPVLSVLTEIVESGAYNELYWVPVPKAKSSPQPTLVKGVVPTADDMKALGTKLPSVPETPALLETLWQNRDYDLVRLIDILSHSYGGFSKTDEVIPLGVSIPGFMGVHGHHVALSPAVVAATKLHVDTLKSEKMEGMRLRVERALLAVKRKMGKDIDLGVLWTGMGEVLWKLDRPKVPPLYICLAPWLTTFGQSLGLARVGLHEKPHVMLMIPYQSRPSLLASLGRYSGLSLSDTRWEKSLSLLGDLDKPNQLQVLIGQRHPLLDEILAAVEDSAAALGVKPQYSPPVVGAPAVKPEPKPPQISTLPLGPAKKESIFIGHTFHTRESVAWEPGKGTEVRQPNRNLLIVGKPGTGKSQLIKACVLELEQIGIPSIALDWVGEYSDVLPNTIDARNGITINPLELPSGATPYQTALEIASIIRAVFSGLGDIQESLLRDAVLEAYRHKGILEERPDTWTLNPPTFDDVFDIVRLSASGGTQKAAAQGLKSRISPFVDLKMFSGSTTIPFEQLVGGGISINLGSLYTDDLRCVVGHFFLNKLWYYVQNLGGTSAARFYLVLDEANRLSFPGSPLERLVREARKFGVGIIVASQRPRDFTDTVPANTACSIVFQCPLEQDAAFMAKQMNSRAADIQGLEPTFDTLVKFDYEAEVRRVKVVPYYQRTQA
jgi:hypothetical protein